MKRQRPRLLFTLLVLLGINAMNFFDRQVLPAVQEDLKNEWKLSDRDLGALGTAFILLYAVIGVPLGRWSDVGRRTRILAGGVALWSLLTALSGRAWSFWSLFVMRLGVGVGEATCAPVANSLIGDLFPPQQRARALSVFMLGLPLGLGLSFFVSGSIAHAWGWRWALCVAGLPGLVLAILALWVPEPVRGAAETEATGGTRDNSGSFQGDDAESPPHQTEGAVPDKQAGSPILQLLRVPTLWWIILSGALHNFNMYANGQFLSSFLVRYHGLTVKSAGYLLGTTYGFGGLGILLGGWLCDRIVKRRISGRLEITAGAILLFVPCMFAALSCGPRNHWGFALWLLPASLLSYVYYSGVYAAIQDIVEPASRGTAMALYFFAMYLLGASLGPIATGWISDHFAAQAVIERGALPATAALAAEARAEGLHRAMYLIPWLGCLLVLVLLAASRTIKNDHQKLQQRLQRHR